jgi:subtilase family serine protease
MKTKFILFIILAIGLPSTSFAKASANGRVCSAVKTQGLASCHAHVVSDDGGNFLVSSSPNGFSPNDLRTAYNLSGRSTEQKIVAIVDAYDDPFIKADLDTYNKQFNLPNLPDCKVDIKKSTVPCFQKVNQRGSNSLPKPNGGWAMEIALDVEAVHAVCENCSILLVEAASPNIKNLTAAVDQVIKMNADVVSNSYGGPEFPSETQFDFHFNHPGIAFTVSSGDSGYGVQYPAASPFVTAVGGTSLYLNSSGKYQNEDAWSGAGSGCSEFESKPTWQNDIPCKNRMVTDVSAVADPNTGFAIYSSISPKGQKGWFKAGGTSLAAPIIAAVYALSSGKSKEQSILYRTF